MKGDFTRSTFDARKHYSSVRMQQGRVQLDADWNEQMDILGHRIETEAVDVIGRCGFPKHAPGFKIEETDDDLLIGPGRAYVDGILCELEGDPITFKTQPHLPNAAELLENAEPGIYFAYLDVWRRHVTAVEDPAIRETALGGPDTATRLQTVWQVKLVRMGELGTDLTCEDELDAEETTPPTGKLRARTRPVEDLDNPCIMPASAGYTRVENHLYRVEVHQGGELGTASFKWSRDNGSIATEWLSQDSQDENELTVRSTGRDSLLRFEDKGWLELTDDARELRGLPGEMRQIDRVQGDVIELKEPAAVDIADFSPVRKARRWEPPGTLSVEQPVDNEGYLALEGGIEVRFEEGTYRTGDYWLIPARAFIGEFSGDIEWPQDPQDGTKPQALPPHGIDHHYCKLAVVLIDTDRLDVQSDCRDIFPPLTELEMGGDCCEVVVHPGESIQNAIDSLPEAGGAVCLKAGLHTITETIRIAASNITLRGECPGAVVRSDKVHLVEVFGSEGSLERVKIEGIRFEATGSGPGSFNPNAPFLTPALITAEDCDDFSLTSCALIVAGKPGQPHLPVRVAAGVVAVGGARMVIHGNEMRRVTLGVFTLHVSQVEVSGNTLAGPFLPGQDFSHPGSSAGAVGVWISTDFGALHRIEENLVTDFRVGVRLGSDVQWGGDRSVIAGNTIVRQGPLQPPGSEVFAIDVTADECTARKNIISMPSQGCGGIRVIGSVARIENNLIESQEEGTNGIFLGSFEEEPPLLSHEGVIRENRLTGPQFAIIVAAGRSVQVLDNWIAGESDRPVSYGLLLGNTDGARVAGNRISNAEHGIFLLTGQGCRFFDNHLLDGDTGFSISNGSALELSRNRVERMKRWGFNAVQTHGSLTLSGERYAFCGYEAEEENCFGIGVRFAWGEVGIDGCEVVNTGLTPDFEKKAPRAVGIAVLLVTDCRIHGNMVGYSIWSEGATPSPTGSRMPSSSGEHRALFLQGWLDYMYTPGSEVTFSLGGSVQVTDNKLVGPGRSCLVELLETKISAPSPAFSLWYRFSRVMFNDNDCFHVTSGGSGAAAVWLHGSRAVVSGNQIQSTVPAVHFHGMRGVFVGNSVNQPAIGLPGTPLPNPQDKFNLVG